MDRCLFSTYGVCIEHPVNWRIFMDPKTGFSRDAGFIRFEDYVKRHGAQISLSINWQSVESEASVFAQNYCDNVEAQYGQQFKKNVLRLKRKKRSAPERSDYRIEQKSVIDFQGTPAAFVVSEYIASLGLTKSPKDKAVRILQLAFYDEDSRRAVVSSVMGLPERITGQEAFLKELVFSVHCIPEIRAPGPAYPFSIPEAGTAEKRKKAAANL